MLLLILQIVENVLIIYFSLYLLLDLSFFFIFLVQFIRGGGSRGSGADHSVSIKPIEGISILVPAFNEEKTIANCVAMLEQLDYPLYEIIVINDGSRDETLQRVLATGPFRKIYFPHEQDITTRPVNAVYQRTFGCCTVRVMDKQNGGKADALNAGLNIARYPYVCTIDADSFLDRSALWEVIAPFQEDASVAITGGELAVLNEARIVNGTLQALRFPRNPLVVFQIIEYIKSFLISRTGLSRLQGLLIMSGAFTVFRRELLMEAGGFLSPFNRHPVIRQYFPEPRHTVCEDLEVVVRLKRFAREKKRAARTRFLPHPVCWTEVPETLSQLSRQRERWHRGLGEALAYHRSALFDPKYGVLGLFAMPYYLFFEWFSPIAKLLALAFVVLMFFIDMLHGMWLMMLILSITFGAALLMGLATVVIEFWSQRRSPVNRQALRYRTLTDWLRLLFFSVIGDFSYAYLRVVWQLKGIWNFFRGQKSWNKFSRKGIENVLVKE